MAQKNKKSSYPKSFKTFRENPDFYEELTILKAQNTIAELMKNSGTTRTELAKSLNQSKAHVTELLSDGRNLTLRSFARVCFHLNTEVDFQTHTIGAKKPATTFSFPDLEIPQMDNSLLDASQFASNIKGITKGCLPNTTDDRENYDYNNIVNTHATYGQGKAA